MTTMELRRSLFTEVNAVLDSEELTRAAIQALKEVRKAVTTESKSAKQEKFMLNSLKEAFHELDEVKTGRKKSRPAEDLLKELQEMETEEGEKA